MTESGPVSPAGAHEKPPLDDVMLAMDVVDTLRRRERLVTRELDDAGREGDLKKRLKRIYAQQGIEVPDHVIDQGVAALREERFIYKPPQRGMRRKLALLYVRRGKWGKWVGAGGVAVLLALALNYFVFLAPQRALPAELEKRQADVAAIAASDRARARVAQIANAGMSAFRRQDVDGADAALAQLDQFRETLEQEYTLRIVNRPGAQSGVWRVPDINADARNYYLIVEAVDASGDRLTLPIKNEESGKVEVVNTWGLRVEEATFNAVRRDKEDDGILQNARIGFKKYGFLEPEYTMPTSGAAITSW